MSHMSLNERGRITGMPGVEVSVTLYPQRLSVRMRNSIIRMVEARTVEGGWSSQARRLSEALCNKHELQFTTNNWHGLNVVGMLAETAPRVREIVLADWTAWVLENPEYNVGYYRRHHIDALEAIDRCSQNFYIYIRDKIAVRKVTETLAEHTTQEMKDKSRHIVDLLRGTEPIHIITF